MHADGCKRGALARDMRPPRLHAPAPSRTRAPGAARAVPAAQFITAVVAYGTRESASFNFVVKGSDILLIILILCLSFPHANKHNWDDFWHFGDEGVFSAAGIVFFAYSGAPRRSSPPRSRVLRCMCGGSSGGDACLLLTQGTTPRATWLWRWAAQPRPARPPRPPTGRPPAPVAALPAAQPAPRAASPAPCASHRALRRDRGGMAALCSQRRSCAARAGARPGARPAHRHHRLADDRGRPGAAGGLPGTGLRRAWPQRRASRRPLRHAGVLRGMPCALAEHCLKWPSRQRALSVAVLPRRSLTRHVSRAQYALMAIAITLMVPYYDISVLAPFSAAFSGIPGWAWVQYLVSVGAVFGIGTVLLVRHALRTVAGAADLFAAGAVTAHGQPVAWSVGAVAAA